VPVKDVRPIMFGRLLSRRNFVARPLIFKPSRRRIVGGVVGISAASGALFASSRVNLETEIREVEELLPVEYDAQVMNAFFHDKYFLVTSRALEILSQIIPYATRLFIWEYLIRGKIGSHEGLQTKYARELKELLTRLGPCFIKLGQALSIRPDLLPSPFLFELQKLCDAVPSFPTEQALGMIEAELGSSVLSTFDGLDPSIEPIAAASLGQVYKVSLKEDPGVELGLKVQRPDMKYYVLRDLFIVRKVASAMQWLKQRITRQRPFDVALVDNFAKCTMQELDYLNEAKNQQHFRDVMLTRLGGSVYVPEVYHKWTTRKVLVTEWIPGEKLAASPPSTINRLIPAGLECFLLQLLETGLFHADPHPGNLLVTKDGRLALIDFGLVAEVPIQDTATMTRTIVHLMEGNVPGLVEDAIDLGFLPPEVDKASLTPVLQKVFDSAQLAVTDDIKAGLNFQAVQGRRKQFMAVSYDLNKVFYTYPFLVPDYFALITRAMIVLEGIALTGDPNFDLFRSAYPYGLKRAVKLFGYSGVASIVKQAAVRLTEMGLENNILEEPLKQTQ